MVRFRDATIKTKLTWMSVVASASALILATGTFFAYHLFTSRSALIRSLVIQADTIGLNSVSALRFNDDGSAADTLAALRADENVITAAIYAGDGRLFASYAGGGGESAAVAATVPPDQLDEVRLAGRTLRLFHPIVEEGERLGTVDLSYSLDDLYADAWRYAAIVVVVLALSLLAAVLASARIQRIFTTPIARLAYAAEAISRNNDYSVRVAPTGSRDELGVLVHTFNEMLAHIQARDAEVEAGQQRFQRLNEQLEERVLSRTEELEATNKELEAFTYSVSHDLRAPLRRIDGFATLLVDEYGAQLPEDAARYLQRMREGAKQMGELVDDLLNLARLGRQEVRRQVTGLSSIVAQVSTGLKRDTGDRDIEWRIQPLPFVECDPALMEVVFANLLSNAVKYTRPRPHALIEVGTVEQNGTPVVFVRDNGVGFSMKYVDKLFGVFQRLHRAEDFEGTGVGLATVQRILHKHGGAIWAEAELDKGACFYFTVGSTPPPDPGEPRNAPRSTA